jgi:hypothetical protein
MAVILSRRRHVAAERRRCRRTAKDLKLRELRWNRGEKARGLWLDRARVTGLRLEQRILSSLAVPSAALRAGSPPFCRFATPGFGGSG